METSPRLFLVFAATLLLFHHALASPFNSDTLAKMCKDEILKKSFDSVSLCLDHDKKKKKDANLLLAMKNENENATVSNKFTESSEEHLAGGTDILIMRQDTRVPPYVFDVSTYLSNNRDNTSSPFYSQLLDLESYRLGTTGKFHLKLCYPLLTDTPNKCYEFKQTSHPLTISRADQDDVDVEVIQLPYANLRPCNNFTGLRSDSSANSAFLDGNKGTDWWGSIGTKGLFPNNIPGPSNGIPAAVLVDGTWMVTPLAELWAVFYN